MISKPTHRRIGLLFTISILGFFLLVLSKSVAAENDGDGPQYGAIEVSDQETDSSLAQVAPLPKTPPAPDSATRRQSSPPPPASTLRSRRAQPSPTLLASTYGSRTDSRSSQRLAGTPNMFGDLFYDLGGSVFVRDSAANTALADLPLAAASRRVKIAENNKALPENRVFFMYNHFENALHNESNLGPAFVSRDLEVDRYTFGLEKTLFNENWSVELRMPLAGRSEFATPEFAVSGGNAGNLAVVLKRLIYKSDTTAAVIGLGIDTPTGSEVNGFASDTLAGTTTFFTVHNQAVHLMPYAGFLRAPDRRYFYQGFIQCDIPTNGNSIDYTDILGPGTIGILDEQNLLYLDFSAGWWLYRNEDAPRLTGLAAVAEVHYTTTLQDTDLLAKVGVPPPRLFFSNFANRVDVVNLTVGLHAEIANCTTCRVGGVVPLRTGDDRSFDGELQVQLERRF